MMVVYQPRAVLLNVLLLIWLFKASVYAQNGAFILLNCPSTCGAISIPYPFGIGDGCYMDKGFEITCDDSRPFLGDKSDGLEVLEISLDQVRIKGLINRKCNNGTSDEGFYVDLRQSPFTFSNTKNKLVAVGCDIFAYVTPDFDSPNYMTGCVSLCPSRYALPQGPCSGIGCCQTTIPKGLKSFNVKVDSISSLQRPLAPGSDGCSYTSLQDGDLVNSTSRVVNTSSFVVDWAIGNATCKQASILACVRTNTYCVDSTNGPGFRCNCIQGYKGNPYIGCQDIDECQDPNTCVEGTECLNVPGSYYCVCPPGTSGDGRKDGAGCIQDSKRKRIIMALNGIISAGVGLLVLLAIGFILYRALKKRSQIKLKQKFFKRNGGLLLEQQIRSNEGNIVKTKIFAKEELEKATDNFNDSRILGTGGSGTVYKGMLSDGRIVATKKSKIVDESQIGQFINELVILSHINHRNIVKLLGCCLETEVPLLAYEFISNGTLSQHLHGEAYKSSISWENRLRIATEISGALSYMHSSISPPIFHRDIKSSNILLDENYRAKVSDFGISRSVPYEKTHLTTLVQGTFGYLDPEYFHSSQFTDKSDVYSFGVVLLELLTGQKPISSTRSEEEQNLVMHFISSIKENRVFGTLETRVLTEGSKDELLTVARLAKRCLKLVGKKRPTMKEVTAELEGLRRSQERQCLPQNIQETKHWLHESSSFSMSESKCENTNVICKSGPQGLRHARSMI